MTELELAIRMDRLAGAMERIELRLSAAEANDKRFEKLEHDFRLVRWAAGIAVGGTLLAIVNGVAGRMSLRITDAPAPVTSSGASTYPDRVRPDAGAPTSSPLRGQQ